MLRSTAYQNEPSAAGRSAGSKEARNALRGPLFNATSKPGSVSPAAATGAR
jgi:hypothetical protein